MELSRRGFMSLPALAVLSGCAVNYPVEPGTKPVAWWHQAYPRPELNSLLDGFASEYTIAAVEVTAPSEYPKALHAALPTAQSPDVFECAPGPTTEMVTRELLVDLQGVLTEDVRRDFLPVALNAVRVNDHYFAIPQAIDAQLIVYRKSILSKANVKPPKTWAELVDVAKAVSTADRLGFVAGPDGGVSMLGHTLVWAAGAQLIDPETGKAGFAVPAFTDAVIAFRKAHKEFVLPGGSSVDGQDPTPMIEGTTAMQLVGTWRLPELIEKFNDDLGVIPFPGTIDPAHQVVTIGVQSTAVKRGSENEKAATDFAAWLWIDQIEKQLKYVSEHGFRIPVRTSCLEKLPNFKAGVGADVAKLVQSNGHSLPLSWTDACEQAFSVAWKAALEPDADPKELFATAAKAVNKELA